MIVIVWKIVKMNNIVHCRFINASTFLFNNQQPIDMNNESDNSSSNLTDYEIYELFILLQALDPFKRSIIMVLAHLYPKSITTRQLSELAGYSYKSKYIFKSKALDMLEIDELIEIINPTKRLILVRLNPKHELLVKFANVCKSQGEAIYNDLTCKLLSLNDN
jgi:hypothetical protein